MTLGSGALLFMTIATALLPIGIILSTIRYLHSRSRNELWLLRDSLVDDLLVGRIQRSPGADRLLRLVETHIRVAGRHTIGDLMLATAVVKKDLPPISDELFQEGVSASDRPLLDEYLARLWKISFRYLLSSSPAGWILYVAIWIRSRLGRLAERRRPAGDGDRGHATRFGLDLDLDDQPALRKARQVELGRIPDLMPSKRYRRKGERGPILEDMLSKSG